MFGVTCEVWPRAYDFKPYIQKFLRCSINWCVKRNLKFFFTGGLRVWISICRESIQKCAPRKLAELATELLITTRLMIRDELKKLFLSWIQIWIGELFLRGWYRLELWTVETLPPYVLNRCHRPQEEKLRGVRRQNPRRPRAIRRAKSQDVPGLVSVVKRVKSQVVFNNSWHKGWH